MKNLKKIFTSLRKNLFPFLMVLSVLFYEASAAAGETNSQKYYKEQNVIQRNENVYNLLQNKKTQASQESQKAIETNQGMLSEPYQKAFAKDAAVRNIAYLLEQFRSAANGNGMDHVDEDADDIGKRAAKIGFSLEDYGKSQALGTESGGWDWYDNAQTTRKGVSLAEINSEITDMKQALKETLQNAVGLGILTLEESQVIENEANSLIQEGSNRAVRAAEEDGKGHTFIREIQDGTSTALSAENSVTDGSCPSTEFLRQKYHAGCWSCLVVEKLTSAFLNAAKTAYGLAQRAGITLLWLGVVMWLLMWALKNVSSLAQVEPGNILNELIKFMFKVGLAYWFIMGGLPMIKNYFITPIMGFGASIAQQFWPERLEGYTEDWIWEDEVVTEAQEQEITKNIARHNKEKLQEAAQDAGEETTPAAAEQDTLLAPEPVQYDSIEAMVQDIQKAFISILQKQWNELTGSCPSCCWQSSCKPNRCATSGCTNAGHRNYVAQIHKNAGSGLGGNVAYCQASITSAMNQLNAQIGGDVASILKSAGASCANGLTTASKYKNGFSAASATGGNVTLCVKGQMAPNLKLNVGDTIYYHKVTTQGGINQTMGAASGYHAVTYLGGGQMLSFNGDNKGSMCGSYYYNVQGRVACLSCMIREKLKKNPKLADNINKTKLSQLAQGYNVTLINYSGGIYSGSSESGSAQGSSSLIISVDDVKYNGPTDIMSKSVMNSILGATKAITDITAENMILGDAIMCYSTLERGGAWRLDFKIMELYITNAFMWIEGFIIFCFGLLLTMAVIYYLMDMSFKIGFAVIAMPIVVGLWPFNMTKGKLATCVSIIAKGAATFAFLALTTTYTIALTEAVINWGDSPEDVAAGKGGIAKLYNVMDEAGALENKGAGRNEENIDYAAEKLSLFSTTFIMLLFAFLYSFKLVRGTVPDLVDKFFPDRTFGETNPMHQWATAASRWVKDQAMKPVGYARDIALNQAGEKLKGLPKSTFGFAKSMVGKGSGNAKTAAGSTMRGAGNVAKGTGKVAQAAGKGVQGVGKGMSAVGKGLQAIPVVGNVVGGAMMAAGKVTEAAGKGVEMAGKGVEKAGDAAKKAGDATDKAYNEFGTRHKKSENDKDK